MSLTDFGDKFIFNLKTNKTYFFDKNTKITNRNIRSVLLETNH